MHLHIGLYSSAYVNLDMLQLVVFESFQTNAQSVETWIE